MGGLSGWKSTVMRFGKPAHKAEVNCFQMHLNIYIYIFHVLFLYVYNVSWEVLG